MKRTSRQPLVRDGVIWRSYQIGISSYALYSDTEPRICVRRNYDATTYNARLVGGTIIGKRYRSEENALKAAIHHLREVGCKPVSHEADEIGRD